MLSTLAGVFSRPTTTSRQYYRH